MLDCTDCFWCKINRSKGTLRCIIGEYNETFTLWTKRDGSEKVVKLKVSEIKKPSLIWRDIFKLAENCASMKSMG